MVVVPEGCDIGSQLTPIIQLPSRSISAAVRSVEISGFSTSLQPVALSVVYSHPEYAAGYDECDGTRSPIVVSLE